MMLGAKANAASIAVPVTTIAMPMSTVFRNPMHR